MCDNGCDCEAQALAAQAEAAWLAELEAEAYAAWQAEIEGEYIAQAEHEAAQAEAESDDHPI